MNKIIPTLQRSIPLSLALSPLGHLTLYSEPDNQENVTEAVAEKIRTLFALDGVKGLLRLGLTQFNTALPASLAFWQQFAQIFIAEVCKHSGLAESSFDITIPEEVTELLHQAPFMRGVEYLNIEMLTLIWQALATALQEELKLFAGSLVDYLSAYHAAWNTVGRICFHLAENKNDPKYPFAFLATYTVRLSKTAQPQHLPLGQALKDYAAESKQSILLALLLPVQKAAEKSLFLKNLLNNKMLFQPLAWSAKEAHQFLNDIQHFEAAGIMVRIPNWWNPKKPARPTIKISIGNAASNAVGLDALLDFNMQCVLPSGETLTPAEMQQLQVAQEKFIQIRGQWVEVDSEKLQQVLTHWQTLEKKVKNQGLSFAEGLRLLAGMPTNTTEDLPLPEVHAWSQVCEGTWMREVLTRLRNPDIAGEKRLHSILTEYLKAQLRPYQMQGVQWLWWLYNMRLGGCLADDMGLGKTIQVLALFLLIKYQKNSPSQPHLLILPASLLGNWQAELQRFAPSLISFVAHSSSENEQWQTAPALDNIDVVITTYAMLQRLPWLNKINWNLLILDEAQAIKNPVAKQTRAAKMLACRTRFTLTGTPIENRLLDVWSLFDFVAPGLLGSSKTFADYGKKNNAENGQFYASVRQLLSPYILRRLKTDKRIISDLPDKTEMPTYCLLTKQQIGLYQQSVTELMQQLEVSSDNSIQRRGLVLSYLLRFKQICNHPNQWLGHGDYAANLSGKFIRLKELAEVIAAKQEKVLVFTQFREIIPALCEFLTAIFGRPGLFLHGQTLVPERAKRVAAFQAEQGPPFFILSLKAGGTGLNLTAAAHVIHFDRWWNPAVENQATDRAYRIGQKKNVLVHKFICQGTIEEKIDALINTKKSLAEEIIGKSNEIVLTELSDTQLLNIITLDIHRALGD